MTRELEVAIKAAKEAGKILKKHFHQPNKITLKADKSFVTQADKLAEEKIISIIKENFPDHSINAEESGLVQKNSEYLWLIDPLDGTTNYATHVPFFTVSVALVFNKKIQIGVVFDPIHGELFSASVNEGAYLNNSPIKVSEKGELALSIIGYSRPSSLKDKFTIIFPSIEIKTRGPKILGSTALQLCYVASNRLDADVSFSQQPWDLAAGVLVIEEAGGKASDFEGNPWSIDSKDILATNGKIHDEILEIINR